MATTLLLVRHADHELLGRVLAGRMPGVSLSSMGRSRAEALARRLEELARGGMDIAAVQSSPRERALETARPIAAALGLPCETMPALDEIEFGAWTGKRFTDLDGDPLWREWNGARGRARPPGGESMAEARDRLLAHLADLCAAYPDGRVVLVSHADMIKAALLHVLGLPPEAYGRIEVDPAGVSAVVLGPWGGPWTGKVLSLNERMAP